MKLRIECPETPGPHIGSNVNVYLDDKLQDSIDSVTLKIDRDDIIRADITFFPCSVEFTGNVHAALFGKLNDADREQLISQLCDAQLGLPEKA